MTYAYGLWRYIVKLLATRDFCRCYWLPLTRIKLLYVISISALKSFFKNNIRKLIMKLLRKVNTYWPSSHKRLACRHPCKPRVISVIMSASFFWMSWVAARGRPNWILSRVYWRAAERQNSAAPKAPQAIPSLADVKQVNGPWRGQTSKLNF